MKNIIIIISIVAVMLVLVSCASGEEAIFSSENTTSDETTNFSIQKNLKGNHISGGYINSYENYIYFSNNQDNNKLYQRDKSGGNIQKLSDHQNANNRLLIQKHNDSLYYLQNSKKDDDYIFHLYSYDLKNKQEKLLSDKNILDYVVGENEIFFTDMIVKDQNADYKIKSSNLYKMSFDGSNVELIDEYDYLCYMQYYNHMLYVDFDEALVSMNVDGTGSQSKYIGLHNNLIVYGNAVYFIGADGCLRSSDLDISNYDSTIVIDQQIRSYLIYNDRIYFVSYDSKIYRSDLSGNSMEYIADGSNPVIVDDVIHYINTDNGMSYTVIH